MLSNVIIISLLLILLGQNICFHHKHSVFSPSQTLMMFSNSWFESMMFWKKEDKDKETKLSGDITNEICLQRPKDAVLVFGATGRTGQHIVRKLQKYGRDVVVVAKDESNMKRVFSDLLTNRNIYFIPGIDATVPSTLDSGNVFDGVSQIVSAIGPPMINTKDPARSSESIDFRANVNIINKCRLTLSSTNFKKTKLLSENGQRIQWTTRDDTVMGGRSSSGWNPVQSPSEQSNVERIFDTWEGMLSIVDGGFCGTVSNELLVDFAAHDGVLLCVRGDGFRYKVLHA